MRLTLELNEAQAKYFEATLDVSLRSLVWQEIQLKEALEKGKLTDEEERNIQAHLVEVTCQRVLVAEVLGTVKETEKKHSILTDGIMPSTGKIGMSIGNVKGVKRINFN